MQYVCVEQRDWVLNVKLNRPGKRNAFNAELIAELTAIFTLDGIDSCVRVMHLTGAGLDFCAGADLSWMATVGAQSSAENRADGNRLWAMYRSMLQCPIPIVTQVHGRVLGGGVGLCAASDIVVAETNAVFALSEVKRGLLPAVMMPFVVQKMGWSRPRELTITARSFSAAEAQDYGLVHFVVNSESANATAEQCLTAIIRNGPEAILASRHLLDALNSSTSHFNRDLCVDSLIRTRAGAEAREGIEAFFEDRPPHWSREIAQACST